MSVGKAKDLISWSCASQKVDSSNANDMKVGVYKIACDASHLAFALDMQFHMHIAHHETGTEPDGWSPSIRVDAHHELFGKLPLHGTLDLLRCA